MSGSPARDPESTTTEFPATQASAVAQDDTATVDVLEEASIKDNNNAHVSPATTGSHDDHDSDDESEEGEVKGRDGENPEEALRNPPLPSEPPPDDGWQPVWDANAYRYYFYNSYTGETTWTNPRVPEATDVTPIPYEAKSVQLQVAGGYNPAIHGDYDPTAPYAQAAQAVQEEEYTSVARFNRFTGKFTPADSKLVPENYNDENKARRQLNFYFDADAAANSHDGRSLKAERQTKKLTKKELKEFKAKRKEKKEQKRRAWLKD